MQVLVNGVPVPVYLISPGQVNAQAPSNISGTMTVQVVRLGLPSNTLTVAVAQIQPSLYYYQVGSKSYAAALFSDYTIMGDPAVVPGTRKAKPGDIMQLYAAGLGPSPSGGAITTPIEITGVGVTIGTTDAQVLYAGLVAPGQFQVNFVVPQLADGEYQIVRDNRRQNFAAQRAVRDRAMTALAGGEWSNRRPLHCGELSSHPLN